MAAAYAALPMAVPITNHPMLVGLSLVMAQPRNLSPKELVQ